MTDTNLDFDDDEDDGHALVQSSNFTTLFVLSRQQNPSQRRIQVSLFPYL